MCKFPVSGHLVHCSCATLSILLVYIVPTYDFAFVIDSILAAVLLCIINSKVNLHKLKYFELTFISAGLLLSKTVELINILWYAYYLYIMSSFNGDSPFNSTRNDQHSQLIKLVRVVVYTILYESSTFIRF